jgi:hypothetical protein
MTYLIIYQIEPKLTTLPMGYSQMGHLVLSWTKQNDMFGQDDQWFFNQINILY